MSIIFIPPQLEFGKISKRWDFDISRQNTFLISEMSFGTHSRIKGTPTVRELNLTLILTPERVPHFDNFFDLIQNNVFYSTFPDINYGGIDYTQFYAFSVKDASFAKVYLEKGWYTSAITVYWHYRVPPISRT